MSGNIVVTASSVKVGKEKAVMQSSLKVVPEIREQIADYCAKNSIPASVLINRALAQMGVKIDAEDLEPSYRGGRPMKPVKTQGENQRIQVPFQMKKYIRKNAAVKMLKTGLTFTAFTLSGMKKLGFNIPDEHIAPKVW